MKLQPNWWSRFATEWHPFGFRHRCHSGPGGLGGNWNYSLVNLTPQYHSGGLLTTSKSFVWLWLIILIYFYFFVNVISLLVLFELRSLLHAAMGIDAWRLFCSCSMYLATKHSSVVQKMNRPNCQLIISLMVTSKGFCCVKITQIHPNPT